MSSETIWEAIRQKHRIVSDDGAIKATSSLNDLVVPVRCGSEWRTISAIGSLTCVRNRGRIRG